MKEEIKVKDIQLIRVESGKGEMESWDLLNCLIIEEGGQHYLEIEEYQWNGK